jgi:hypothetical protein
MDSREYIDGYIARARAAQAEVDPSAAVMAGADQSAAGPMPETVYATPGARDGIAEEAEDVPLPF